MDEVPLELDNALWRFSCAVYAAPRVAAACLALQDRFGVDVNLALLCAWVGAVRGGAMDEASVAAAAALAGPWREAVVAPLRAARRGLKPMALMQEAPVAALRGRLAELELEAEQVQQAVLFRWAGPRWPAVGGDVAQARGNLAVLLRGKPGADPFAALLAAASGGR